MSEQNVSLEEAFGGEKPAEAPAPETEVNISAEDAFGVHDKPSPVATGEQMLERKPAGPVYTDVAAPTAPGMVKGTFDLMQRPAAAVGAFMSAQEDAAKFDNLTAGQSIMKGMEAAWAKFKGDDIKTLSVGELFQQRMLQEGSAPGAAEAAGLITNMVLESVTDPTNAIGPVYRQAVNAGVSKKFLDGVIRQAKSLKVTKAAKEAAEMKTTSAVLGPANEVRQAPKPSVGTRFISAFLGTRPENVVMYGNHAAEMSTARPLTEISNNLQVYFDNLAEESSKLTSDYMVANQKANFARQNMRQSLEFKASPKTNAGVIKSAVSDLEDKSKALSSAGFDVLGESDLSIPTRDVVEATRNFQASVMGQTADMFEPIPISPEQSKIMADMARVTDGLMARYGDEIPLPELKRLLKDELPFDKYGKNTGDYDFPSAIQRAWRKDFHGYLNGKLKEVAPKEYSELMQEAHAISQFLENNTHILKEERIPAALSKYRAFLDKTGVAPDEEAAVFDQLAKLSGRQDVSDGIKSFENASRTLKDQRKFQEMIKDLPEVQEESFYSEAIGKYDEWRKQFVTMQRGPNSSASFVKRISNTPADQLSVNDIKTLNALNVVLSEEAQKPVNIYQEILDRKVLDSLSPGARADTQSARRTLGAGGVGGAASALAVMGGAMDPQTAAFLTAASVGTGFILDRYGPAVAKMYADAAYSAPKMAVTLGKTGAKMANVMGNLDNLLPIPFAYGFIDQLVNPNSALHRDGHGVITDRATLDLIKTQVRKSKDIRNSDKARIVDDIANGYLDLKSSGIPQMEKTEAGAQPLKNMDVESLNQIIREGLKAGEKGVK